jgi:hypothetical protein
MFGPVEVMLEELIHPLTVRSPHGHFQMRNSRRVNSQEAWRIST